MIGSGDCPGLSWSDLGCRTRRVPFQLNGLETAGLGPAEAAYRAESRARPECPESTPAPAALSGVLGRRGGLGGQLGCNACWRPMYEQDGGGAEGEVAGVDQLLDSVTAP